MRLKNRNLSIPNGLFFRQPEIKWDSRRVLQAQPSFSTLVSAVITARRANPFHTSKNNWATDYDSVANEVDSFNASVAMSMPGGDRFVSSPSGGGAPLPFYKPRSQDEQKLLSAVAAKARKIWAGLSITRNWKDSGEPAVPAEQSTARALTCSDCPQNQKGDWTKWFTAPAAAAIKKQMEWLLEKKLSTPHDDKIMVCDVCLCPLAFKVHTPIKFIKPDTTDEVLAELRSKGKNCWVCAEIDAQ